MAWLEWQNFLFLAPLITGLLMAVLVVATGAIGDGDSPDVDDMSDADDASGFDVLGWFGIGKGVPFSLMLPVLLCTFGLVGYSLELLILEPVLRSAIIYAPIAVLGALFGSSIVGRGFAKGFVKFTDANRKTAVKTSADFIGCFGTTVFEVDSSNGAANIKDGFGNIHRVVARAKNGIASNKPVRVVAVENSIFLVEEQHD
jgi:Protein of unknown function (DUF1449)